MAAKKGNKYAVGNPGQPIQKYTPEFIAQIAKDMLEWVKRPDSLFLDSFVGEYKEFIDHRLFSEWEKKHKDFGESYCQVKKRLVGKLKTGSALKGLDGNFVAKILPLVDVEYREWRREELKLESDAKSMPVIQVVNYKKEK